MEIHSILELQASLLFFLGCVVLLAHQTSRTPQANAGAKWFFAASVCGSSGLALQTMRGSLPELWTIVAGNLLFLLLVVLLTRSIALAIQSSSKAIPYLIVLAFFTAGMLAYYTFLRPDVTRRVLIAYVMLSVMLMPSVVLLLCSRQRAIRMPTRVLAGIFLFFILTCGLGVAEILRGAQPKSGASWSGAILIAGVALCFLWMDMLRLRAELESEAMTDPLTGLLNRRTIETLAERELSRAARNETAVSLLTIDVDHFKSINDSHGHVFGDRALLGLASTLRNTLRSQDLAVRMGGDEFVVLLTESSPQIAQRIAQRIQEDVAALDLKNHAGETVQIAVTVGRYTTHPNAKQSYAHLIHASDMDLYMRKQQRSSEGKELELNELAESALQITASN